jgi:hypothetical protein
MVVQDAAISRELWLRSKHGTWRLFRLTVDGLAPRSAVTGRCLQVREVRWRDDGVKTFYRKNR